MVDKAFDHTVEVSAEAKYNQQCYFLFW